MPDRRKHRGRHPQDETLFRPALVGQLRVAVEELGWLLTRGYSEPSALKLVGDRYGLTARQRAAVRRSTCSNQSRDRRAVSRIGTGQCAGRALAIDGYNLLITVESALGNGAIFVGRDGCYRDLASIHGTYRKVQETIPAVKLIADYLPALGVRRVEWLLDRPVSNSGRLRALMYEVLPQTGPEWTIELADSPDQALIAFDGVAATSDSAVLDRCGAWVNLAAEIVRARVPSAWVIDLGWDGGGDTGQ